MFAVQVFERDPLRYQDLPLMLADWARVVGVIALVGAALWLALLGLTRVDWKRIPVWQLLLFAVSMIWGSGLYTAGSLLWSRRLGLAGVLCAVPADVLLLLWQVRALIKVVTVEWKHIPAWQKQLFVALMFAATGLYGIGALMAQSPRLSSESLLVQSAGGVCAILAVSLGFLRNLPQLSARRIGAITRLSFKEALRRRVPYVFALLLLVYLFANWYVPYKPEQQVQTYVNIVYYAMVPLLLLSALVLGAFSIPNDIKQQTIHTILTKPVERFEVVLGRFLGFTGLLTVILLVMTTLSLLYVLRNVDPAAAAESLRARDPLYGELAFEGTGDDPRRAESVGREWAYRSYIAGPMPGKKPQHAVWTFPTVPAALAGRPLVRCEFSFDVYRLHVGTEGQNLSCEFVFLTRNYKKGNETEYRRQLAEDKKNHPDKEKEIENELTEKYGYFEVPGKNVLDYHTQSIDVPGGLFKNALQSNPSAGKGPPALQVRVRNNSASGYVGMARYDLYFLQDDPGQGMDTLWFSVNFFKGALGLWFCLVLVCGLAVALSTYLSGVISLLITCMLYIGGMFEEFIRTVAAGTNFGGGPMEALTRILSRGNLNAPLEENALKTAALQSDYVFRFLIRSVLNVLPDVDRFSLTSYVAEGFNIPLSQLVLSLIILTGYLLPWAVLAYYLMKWREIASQT